MARVHVNIKSRSTLLFIAFVSLLLSNLRSFLSLSHRLSSVANLLGILLTWFVVWNLYQLHDQLSQEPEDKSSTSRMDALFAVAGTALLLANRFIHLSSSRHGLLTIAGWLLIITGWSFPTSRAQSFAISGVCLIALYDIRWRTSAAFRDVPIYVTLALPALWLAISTLTYVFLSRRKPTTFPSGLN
jgi:hypothetical protein